MTYKEPERSLETGLIKDPVLLKQSVINCFSSIFDEDFVSHEKLNEKSPYSFFYSFTGGQITFYADSHNHRSLYNELYALYQYAERIVEPATRTALKKKSSSYDNYMMQCVLIYFIFSQHLSSTIVKKRVDNPNMWWVEKMFVDDVPVNDIMFAATLGTAHLTEKDYEDFTSNIRTMPKEWLHYMYPADGKKSFS